MIVGVKDMVLPCAATCDCHVAIGDQASHGIRSSWFKTQLKRLEQLADFALAALEVGKGLDKSTIGKFKRVRKLGVISSRLIWSFWACYRLLRKAY